MKYAGFLDNKLFERPFCNTVLPDEHYASLIHHLQEMERYMIKLNSGQDAPDNGEREIYNEHFAAVKQLVKTTNVPVAILYAMAAVYQTHPALAEARLRPPAPQPAQRPPVDLNPEVDLSDLNTADELNEYAAALGNLAMLQGAQVQSVSEEDQKDILQIIEILENEPNRLPPEHGIDEVKSCYQAIFRNLEANEYMTRIVAQWALGHQKRWKKNVLN